MWHAWGKGKVFTRFWLEGPKVRDHWEDLGVGGRMTKMDLRGLGIDGEKWIRMTQDRIQWRDFVNTVINLRIP
jgi:hypothetical protein